MSRVRNFLGSAAIHVNRGILISLQIHGGGKGVSLRYARTCSVRFMYFCTCDVSWPENVIERHINRVASTYIFHYRERCARAINKGDLAGQVNAAIPRGIVSAPISGSRSFLERGAREGEREREIGETRKRLT